jgi:hypothetical protein
MHANAPPSSSPPRPAKQQPAVVVGARGKVGGTIAGLLRAKSFDPVVAVNRGDDAAASAFCALPPNTPVWLCTTTDALGDALEDVPTDRLDDCIILQNGVVDDELRRAAERHRRRSSSSSSSPLELTRLMLYLRAADPKKDQPWEDGGGRTLVRPGGRHSEHAAAVLPGAAVARDRAEFLRAARDKLAWCCAAWLVSQGSGGLSLGEVVAKGELKEALRALAAEAAPAAMSAAAGEEEDDGGEDCGGVDEEQQERLACADAVLAYCASIPGAVPSRDLALREWRWRNGAVLRAAAAERRLGALPLHAVWCGRAGVGLDGAGARDRRR